MKENIDSDVILMGYLSEKEVSHQLQKANLILAPFMDGVSTRRGTFMAAIQHGAAVLTTRGWATDSTFAWEAFCEVSENNIASYTKSAIELLNNESRLNTLKIEAKKIYQENFSWEKIAQEVERIAHQIIQSTRTHL